MSALLVDTEGIGCCTCPACCQTILTFGTFSVLTQQQYAPSCPVNGTFTQVLTDFAKHSALCPCDECKWDNRQQSGYGYMDNTGWLANAPGLCNSPVSCVIPSVLVHHTGSPISWRCRIVAKTFDQVLGVFVLGAISGSLQHDGTADRCLISQSVSLSWFVGNVFPCQGSITTDQSAFGSMTIEV